ncbi:MAG TPA: alpha/beta hydrolase [Limnobacter sp.]|uniref:alpha/beta hydrolase n=1 Tax=Limnobacter sp. TaxID=2003368 RepID=UPI002E330E2D|nr:alpha/beta hydrolase [Limnobacter sp.]HEX5486354.1 alpha/beta hydrolase [Limnobacter sp.]
MKQAKLFLITLKVIPLFILSGCSGLQLVNAVSRSYYPATIEKNLVFDSNHKLAYDLYLPEKPIKFDHKTPVVVFIFGGSWNSGEKTEYEFAGRRLASLGYIAAIPNYRLYPQVTYPQFLYDGANAVKAITEELKKSKYADYNPDSQIIMMGHSAGAYNAAMLTTDPKWLSSVGLNKNTLIKGFVGLAGPYNIYPIYVEDVKPVFHDPNYPPDSMPIDFADNKQPPCLILAPENDTLVRTNKNSVAFFEKLKASGNNAELDFVKGTDHVTLMGTFSPILFFKGSSIEPIQKFIDSLYDQK